MGWWIAGVLAVAFGVYVLLGVAYEPRTVVAMAVRSAFWVAQALVLPVLLRGVSASARRGRV